MNSWTCVEVKGRNASKAESVSQLKSRRRKLIFSLDGISKSFEMNYICIKQRKVPHTAEINRRTFIATATWIKSPLGGLFAATRSVERKTIHQSIISHIIKDSKHSWSGQRIKIMTSKWWKMYRGGNGDGEDAETKDGTEKILIMRSAHDKNH